MGRGYPVLHGVHIPDGKRLCTLGSYSISALPDAINSTQQRRYTAVMRPVAAITVANCCDFGAHFNAALWLVLQSIRLLFEYFSD